ncbi:hypothetical protein GCM10009416_46160 [Craurococcus roseus]|uniref:Uncharacterized protein n=1 Tax=Craurococcus roseus TaxID=77585 RepID=A0ABN1G3F6_9PROT
MAARRARPRLAAVPGEAEVLQVGEGDAAHQRVAVQPGPGAPLEAAQAQFLLELLVRLLANPARLDGGGEGAQRRPGRQVGEVVFPLARRAVFATSHASPPGRWRLLPQVAPSPTRTRTAANRAASVPFVPRR